MPESQKCLEQRRFPIGLSSDCYDLRDGQVLSERNCGSLKPTICFISYFGLLAGENIALCALFFDTVGVLHVGFLRTPRNFTVSTYAVYDRTFIQEGPLCSNSGITGGHRHVRAVRSAGATLGNKDWKLSSSRFGMTRLLLQSS